MIYRFVIPDRWFESARNHVQEVEGVRDPNCGMEVDPEADDTVTLETDDETVYFCSETCRDAYREKIVEMTVAERLLTLRGWANASQNAIGEWKMLWKDIVAGFLIAGLIAAFVPREWWAELFGVAGGTLSTVIFSCVIGVFIGVVTFVCSVGNVPFALILWQNGMAFGGVMSFIFADLIVPTIANAYRRYYGLKIALTMFCSIFLTAAVAGVIIHFIWVGLDLVPEPGQPGGRAPEGYTVYLNLMFTVLFMAQLVVMKKRKR